VTGIDGASASAPGESREERRRAIEAQARGLALVGDELGRRERLSQEVAALRARAGPGRRLLAALVGSWPWALLAGDRRLGRGCDSEPERRGAALRRERFRLMRRRRALERGLGGLRAQRPPRVQRRPQRSAVAAPGAAPQAATFCIRIAGRDWESAGRGGDAGLASSLARELRKRGHPTTVRLAGEAGEDALARADVEVALRGRSVGAPDPNCLNLVWQISHPGETNTAELNRYDRVLVASRRHAERLRGEVAPPVETLLQFTDPELFRRAPDAAPKHDVAFVGNWRGVYRRIVWDAIEAGHPPALYGQGWELLAPAHTVAEHVPHAELHRLYSSCEILLCDHWDDMRRLGFVSNRIFDALACGTFVLADDNPALAEELPGIVPTYCSPDELGELIEHYLADPGAREQRGKRGRALVLAEHTAGRRAEQLLATAAAAARECSRPGLAHLREDGGVRWTDARTGDASAAAAEPRATGAAPA
jgi:glycosyltransferase involved in cell wall biosynthesis